MKRINFLKHLLASRTLAFLLHRGYRRAGIQAKRTKAQNSLTEVFFEQKNPLNISSYTKHLRPLVLFHKSARSLTQVYIYSNFPCLLLDVICAYTQKISVYFSPHFSSIYFLCTSATFVEISQKQCGLSGLPRQRPSSVKWLVLQLNAIKTNEVLLDSSRFNQVHFAGQRHVANEFCQLKSVLPLQRADNYTKIIFTTHTR